MREVSSKGYKRVRYLGDDMRSHRKREKKYRKKRMRMRQCRRHLSRRR